MDLKHATPTEMKTVWGGHFETEKINGSKLIQVSWRSVLINLAKTLKNQLLKLLSNRVRVQILFFKSWTLMRLGGGGGNENKELLFLEVYLFTLTNLSQLLWRNNWSYFEGVIGATLKE